MNHDTFILPKKKKNNINKKMLTVAGMLMSAASAHMHMMHHQSVTRGDLLNIFQYTQCCTSNPLYNASADPAVV